MGPSACRAPGSRRPSPSSCESAPRRSARCNPRLGHPPSTCVMPRDIDTNRWVLHEASAGVVSTQDGWVALTKSSSITSVDGIVSRTCADTSSNLVWCSNWDRGTVNTWMSSIVRLFEPSNRSLSLSPRQFKNNQKHNTHTRKRRTRVSPLWRAPVSSKQYCFARDEQQYYILTQSQNRFTDSVDGAVSLPPGDHPGPRGCAGYTAEPGPGGRGP